jgi:hypothetical protein
MRAQSSTTSVSLILLATDRNPIHGGNWLFVQIVPFVGPMISGGSHRVIGLSPLISANYCDFKFEMGFADLNGQFATQMNGAVAKLSKGEYFYIKHCRNLTN